MKKSLLAVVAALAMAGCSQNDLVDEIDNGGQISKVEIGFSSVVGKNSRAAEVGTDELQTNGFYVYAYNIGESAEGTGTTELINNEKVTYDNGAWKSYTYYWPGSNYVRFYAFSSTKTSLKIENSKLAYTVPTTASAQEDLLVKTITQNKTTPTVTFVFTHALTELNFSILGKEEGLTYTVEEASLTGVKDEGSYDYSKEEWADLKASGSDLKYSIPLEIKPEVKSTSISAQFNSGALMLLPQELTDISIEIKYTVKNDKGITVSEGESITKTVPLSSSTTPWTANKKIRYTLTLANDTEPIQWVATAGTWGTESEEK
ncbi:fimbrillin family protein [Phocaeicola sp.]